jgi:hypothetical protein
MVYVSTIVRGHSTMHAFGQRITTEEIRRYTSTNKGPRSKDFGNESSFLEEDEDMLMVKSLDYKLQARNASGSRSQSQKSEKKKARKFILEQPAIEEESGSSNHIVETDSSQ